MSQDQTALSAEAERDGRLRALAELDNLRKQKNLEIAQTRDQAEEYVIREFLEVIDDFERAFEIIPHIRGRGAKQKVAEGFQLIFDKFRSVLRRLEIEGFSSEGQRFNAELMQAIGKTPTLALPPGTVAGEAKRGYTRRGRLLRPAQVSVAVPPEESDGT